MSLRGMHDKPVAEDRDDLGTWLRKLTGCPPVTHTVAATCTTAAHGDEPAEWFFVEADRREGVARLRCLSCGDARSVLDSADHWTYPAAWSCPGCSQSIAEVAFGVHDEHGVASWMALAVRCVNCGETHGLADFVLPDLPTGELLASL